ncbi:hypothetical protein N9B71_04340 [Pirellulales bacterium]|jgi:hypothetical protein|nr:hypothetical protein [Pirellulales bacterium]
MAASLIITAFCLNILFLFLWFMAFKVTVIKKILGVWPCLGVSLFSFFGFLASFEPGSGHAYWKAVYGAVLLFSLVIIFRITGMLKYFTTRSTTSSSKNFLNCL